LGVRVRPGRSSFRFLHVPHSDNHAEQEINLLNCEPEECCVDPLRPPCFLALDATGKQVQGGPAPTLIKSDGKSKSSFPCLTPCVNDPNLMAFHSPYATTIWDYINRAMPLNEEGTRKPIEVYALTAYLLYKNGIIREDEVMDAQSLPKVKMPNRDHFALAPEWEHGTPRLQGYP